MLQLIPWTARTGTPCLVLNGDDLSASERKSMVSVSGSRELVAAFVASPSSSFSRSLPLQRHHRHHSTHRDAHADGRGGRHQAGTLKKRKRDEERTPPPSLSLSPSDSTSSSSLSLSLPLLSPSSPFLASPSPTPTKTGMEALEAPAAALRVQALQNPPGRA